MTKRASRRTTAPADNEYTRAQKAIARAAFEHRLWAEGLAPRTSSAPVLTGPIVPRVLVSWRHAITLGTAARLAAALMDERQAENALDALRGKSCTKEQRDAREEDLRVARAAVARTREYIASSRRRAGTFGGPIGSIGAARSERLFAQIFDEPQFPVPLGSRPAPGSRTATRAEHEAAQHRRRATERDARIAERMRRQYPFRTPGA